MIGVLLKKFLLIFSFSWPFLDVPRKKRPPQKNVGRCKSITRGHSMPDRYSYIVRRRPSYRRIIKSSPITRHYKETRILGEIPMDDSESVTRNADNFHIEMWVLRLFIDTWEIFVILVGNENGSSSTFDRMKDFNRALSLADEELSLDYSFHMHTDSFGYYNCGIDYKLVEEYLRSFARVSNRSFIVYSCSSEKK